MKRLLITFGCSWTFGVGVNYTQGISLDQFKNSAWDEVNCSCLSFRGLLSKKYNLVNRNWACGGSSNQLQFRLAKLFFSSDEFKELQKTFDQILVLWGITSTARNEMFSIDDGKLINFFYSHKSNLAKMLVNYSYSHDNEVDQLSMEMRHWNTFFKNLNINNLWFDTFNHHHYHSENLIFDDENPRDLLSKLAIHNGFKCVDNKYHESDWTADSDRIKNLVSCGILNPFSHHPTQLGHVQIADMLSEYIEASL